MPTRQNARLAEKRRLRKCLALHAAGVPIEEISNRMYARPKTIRKMLATAGIHPQETEKGA